MKTWITTKSMAIRTLPVIVHVQHCPKWETSVAIKHEAGPSLAKREMAITVRTWKSVTVRNQAGPRLSESGRSITTIKVKVHHYQKHESAEVHHYQKCGSASRSET